MKKKLLIAAFITLIAGGAFAGPFLLPQIMKEGATAILTLGFKDYNGQPVVPSSVDSMTVLDKATNQVLCVVPTPLPTYSSTMAFELKPECQQIANPVRDQEIHRIEVWFKYQGGNKVGSDFAEYNVDNLRGLAVGCAPTPTGSPAAPVCGLTPVPTPTPTS